jgi:CBS domain-containing protein
MPTAREVMHAGVTCVGENQPLTEAAKMMRDLHIGAVPICGTDDRLKGIITDRDITVRCVAEGLDPQSTAAGQLALGPPVWVDAGADIRDALRLMEEHKIRRLPVIDQHRLVGIISEADIVTHLSEQEVEEFSYAVYSAPPNS